MMLSRAHEMRVDEVKRIMINIYDSMEESLALAESIHELCSEWIDVLRNDLARAAEAKEKW